MAAMTVAHRRIAVSARISLSLRLYEGAAGAPVICLPGLTRNAADFEALAPKIAAAGRTVAALSLRGRGASDWDPATENYFPTVYRDDVLAVLNALGWSRAVYVGTSLGGIIAMLTAEAAPERMAGAVVNDVGPVLAPEGLARIAGYVGGDPTPASSLDAAAARIRAVNEIAFPDRDDAFWRDFARRTHRETADGWRLDYDPKIGAALVENGPAPDLWPGWKALAAMPTLLVHGTLSDLLTDPIVAEMAAANPAMAYVRVPNTGHAPMMTEPAAWTAIEKYLAALE